MNASRQIGPVPIVLGWRQRGKSLIESMFHGGDGIASEKCRSRHLLGGLGAEIVLFVGTLAAGLRRPRCAFDRCDSLTDRMWAPREPVSGRPTTEYQARLHGDSFLTHVIAYRCRSL
jgi:hypothetical protein